MKTTENTADIWNEFSGQIRGYLLSKVKQKDDADDLLQEIFIKIHSRLGDLKDEKKLAPWIYQIVRNSLTDHYRKNGLRTSEFDEEVIIGFVSSCNFCTLLFPMLPPLQLNPTQIGLERW